MADESSPFVYADGNPSLRGGKAFGQTLDEAGWLIDLVRAYDLLRGTSTLSALESKQFEENVIRQAVPVLQGNPFGIHNIQNWHNAGIMLGSLALRDPVTACLAVRGADGLHDQAVDTAPVIRAKPQLKRRLRESPCGGAESIEERGDGLFVPSLLQRVLKLARDLGLPHRQ